MLVVCPKILLSKSVNYFLVNMKDAHLLHFSIDFLELDVQVF